ncbi:MAG: hypothetical protein IIA67_04685 [Planctomycetes bacterium]|nr:hypothetical protein [Planctomycetota bacterium]
MSRQRPHPVSRKAHVRHDVVALAKTASHGGPLSKRARGGRRNERLPFVPPEDWHESRRTGESDLSNTGYRIVVQPPGPGYRHVVTPDEVRQRLGQLPPALLKPLEIIQFSQMTRKKMSFPCYGMQWGSSLYLYPLEEELVEYFAQPPKPALMNEVKMFGGRWIQDRGNQWRLVWSERAIKDFYLNNILIHELGHLLDDRNSGYVDRERFAEWFALEHGYKPTRKIIRRGKKQLVRRRHHARQ